VHLCRKLGWELPSPDKQRSLQPPFDFNNLERRQSPSRLTHQEAQRVGNSHVWLFDGAEGGRWLRELEREITPQAPQPTASDAPHALVDRDARPYKRVKVA